MQICVCNSLNHGAVFLTKKKLIFRNLCAYRNQIGRVWPMGNTILSGGISAHGVIKFMCMELFTVSLWPVQELSLMAWIPSAPVWLLWCVGTTRSVDEATDVYFLTAPNSGTPPLRSCKAGFIWGFGLILRVLEKSLKKMLATVGRYRQKLFIAAGHGVCSSLRDPYSGRAGSLMVSEKVSGQARVKQP